MYAYIFHFSDPRSIHRRQAEAAWRLAWLSRLGKEERRERKGEKVAGKGSVEIHRRIDGGGRKKKDDYSDYLDVSIAMPAGS